MKFIIALLCLSLAALASAPRDFSQDGKQYRFVDFEKVHYSITYDTEAKKVSATTEIYFEQKSDGFPIFDLIPNATSVQIDSEETKLSSVQSPAQETNYRSITTYLPSGEHKLVITNQITKNVKYDDNGVISAFWMSDLNDRQYIEQYLPTNIEFDQFAINIDVKITGTSEEHTLYTNGRQLNKAKNSFSVEYPEYFTASSLYFHIAPKKTYKTTSFKFESITGKSIPVIIYKKDSFWGGTSLSSLKKQTVKILTELESKFGKWPHPSLTIYNAGMGGMEYSGATITSTSALGHELTHSYFARGIMPVDGNSGWMDEAIASWRDDGYKSVGKPNFSKTAMAAHSPYRRYTDRNAYSKGANFMAYLNHKVKSFGGLTLFLKNLHTNFTHTSITTRDFIKEINQFSGMSFEKDFKQYIFNGSSIRKSKSTKVKENPYHPRLTEQQLFDLL